MELKTIPTEKYNYIIIDDVSFRFKSRITEMQEFGYTQDGNILIYEDEAKVVKYSCVMKKLIYKAEVADNGIEQRIIREYHYN